MLSFLFAWFASSQEGVKFTYAKFATKGAEYFIRIQEEINELKEEAMVWLKKAVAQKGNSDHH